MRLVEVKLTNYRGYASEVPVKLDPLTVLVGRNDAGKSSILDALDTFFNEAPLDTSDCSRLTGSNEIKIACVFDDLPNQIVIDEQHPTSLAAEYLLRSDGLLEVVKTYACTTSARGKATATKVVANHPSEDDVNDLIGLKITELRTRCRTRAVNLDGVNETIKAQLRSAIWRSAGELQIREQEVDLAKEDGKQLVEQIEAHFPVYALFKSDRASTDQDAEAQDPMKLAIKEIMKGRDADLRQMVGDVEAALQLVADRTVEKIREMSPDLANELQPTVKHKNWDSLFSVSLTADDAIPLNKRGSGTRRMVLLNFFRARAEDDAKDRANAIYAIEEPETSQHPDHQLVLLNAFTEMVQGGRAQVLLTTHTPALARRVEAKNLRFVSGQGQNRTVEFGGAEGVVRKISSTLGVLPSHDVRAFLGVEGKHDVTLLKHLSRILSQSEDDIVDLGEAEERGRLIFIPLGGSTLDQWATKLNGLQVPEFYLTDRDHRPPQPAKYQANVDAWQRAGSTAWITSKRELENYLHPEAIREIYESYVGDPDDPFEDVPATCAMSIHAASIDACPWDELDRERRSSKISKAKARLNSECAERMTAQRLTESDPEGEIRSWLRELTVVVR